MIKRSLNERAKRAAEFSPGRSEAEPGVANAIRNRAHFSGRQKNFHARFCRPLKRAFNFFPKLNSGLRFACPGPNSAASHAGSLTDFFLGISTTKSFFPTSEGGHHPCRN